MHIQKAVATALILALATGPGRAEDAAVRGQIEAQMARFQKAFRNKELAAMRSITTPDFTMKSPDGTVSSRKEAESVIAAEMKSIRSIKEWTLKIERLTVKGNVATAIVSERMVAQVANPLGKDRLSVANARMRETWIKTSAGWRYKRAEALSASSGPANMKFVSATELDTRRPEYVVVRKAIEAQYAVYRKAIRARDFRTAMSTMTDDVTVLYPNGRTFNRKQTEESLRQTLRDLRSVKEWTMKIAHLNVRKTTAVATVGERMVTTFEDYRGTIHNQTLVDFYQDTWIKTTRGWRLRNTRIMRGEVTVDGKTGDPFK